MKAASVLSFCLRQNSKREQKQRLVIGTYELAADEAPIGDKKNGSGRCGGICIVDPTNLLPIERYIRLPSGVFRLIKVPTNAITPFLTSEVNDNSAAVATLTDGRLALFTTDHFDSIADDSTTFLPFSTTLSNGMMLDCAVNSDGRLLCSDNLGHLFVLRFALDGFHPVDFQWRAHSSQFGGIRDISEVWSCCWTDNGQCCASGGEDALLKIWDIRCPTNGPNSAQLKNRSHSAGVIFLASSDSIRKNFDEPTAPNLLLSGSYDDHLRAFDLRQFNRPLSEIKLNGGVWSVERLSDDLLLVACMYGGFPLLDASFFSFFISLISFSLIHSHSVHGPNLLYAATSVGPSVDFCADGSANSTTIASCTFNDAMLRLEDISIC
ncbi:hypothetical protein niasHS_005647 [Heterodera schachtii]|uniref:methylated diphthine methylhydrolase n=1 Tax=Heterodera schachtii TaxID=97005 RepID=A0ABD2JZQ6_HETSC